MRNTHSTSSGQARTTPPEADAPWAQKLRKLTLVTFADQVYTVVRRIPKGRVMTYAEVARAIGKPRSARAVGNALKHNPFIPIVPCHRVVRSDGMIGGYALGSRKKEQMLKREGVAVEHGVVNLKKYQKKPEIKEVKINRATRP